MQRRSKELSIYSQGADLKEAILKASRLLKTAKSLRYFAPSLSTAKVTKTTASEVISQ